jgi:tetratricopeptide (TPR) repeat protein
MLPKDAITIFKQAQKWQQEGKLAKAEVAYRRLAKLNPSFYASLQALGEVLLLQGKLDEAVDAYRNANRLNLHTVEQLGIQPGLGYQSGARWEGVKDNIAMISNYLSTQARTGIDLGCNQGLLTLALADLGVKVTGYEKQNCYLKDALQIAKTSHIPVKFVQQDVGLSDIEALPEVDVILCLSVHHQLVNYYNLEFANTMLKALAKKAQQQFFFQPCCISKKYGLSMPFQDNDYSSIFDYFVKLFQTFTPEFSDIKIIGLSQNNIPKHEPFRPMILLSRKPINERKKTWIIPQLRNAFNRIIYQDKAPIYGSRIFVNTESITKILDQNIFDRTHSGCVVDTDWFSKISPLNSNFKYKACIDHWKNNILWEETGIYEFMENLIVQYGGPDGCKNREDIIKRYERLDQIFDEVKREGRLKTQDELNQSTTGERGGIYIHLGQSGEPIFGGGGHHRLAIAKVLGIKQIPAQVGCVHPSALDTYFSMRQASEV